MKNVKKRVIVSFTIILAVLAIIVINLVHHPNEIADTQQVYLDIENENHDYDRTVLNKDDAERIKSIFTGQDVKKEVGFIFEKGKYRIVFKNNDKEICLYPYCGELTTIKLGERGVNYYFLRENSKNYNQLKLILSHYMELDTMYGISGQS